MSQYTGNFNQASINESYLASYSEVHAQKEVLQQRHYFLLGEIQKMAKELPPKYQQRIPNELLSDIAKCLLDGTVYDIVGGLKEIQLIAEKSLFAQRMKIINAQKLEKQDFEKKSKELLAERQNAAPDVFLQHQIAMQQQKEALLKRHQEETTRMDMKLIMELDQKVSDQQVTLEKAGVPGFSVTNNSTEIRLQMYILEFIQRLSAIELPV